MHKPHTPFWLAVVLSILGSGVYAPNAVFGAGAGKGAYSLRAERKDQAVDFVEAALEVKGELEFDEDGKARKEAMSVAANYAYHEKSLESARDGAGRLRSIRDYQKALAVIKSGKYEYKPSLRDERRLIGVRIDEPKMTLFSPQGPLTVDELDLVDVLANSLLLDRLLPEKPVAKGASWKLSDGLLAAMLRLDTVGACDASCTLAAVADGRATIELVGSVQGTVRGAATKIGLKGRFYFDLKPKRIVWFGLLVKEDRLAGYVEPAFDASARLQMRVTPNRPSDRLTTATLKGLSLDPAESSTQVSYEPAGGGWRLLHDRRWFIHTDRTNQVVLRLIDREDTIAQCTVAPTVQTADLEQVTLESFQKEITQALGDNLQGFVRASQRHSEADYREFRVVAEGAVSEVPVRWIYYLLTDRHGRQVALAFVVEQEKLDLFEESDEKLVRTLQILEPKVAAKPRSDSKQSGDRS
ncbi:MAG: hypothetical protein ACYTG0_32060 [Planctomycetota bacterium]|jgi:hypothetical protein